MAAVRERLRVNEAKQKQMVVFMIKSLKNPLFLQRFVDRMKQRRGPISKRRKVAYDPIKAIDVDGMSVEELLIESEIQPLSPQEAASETNGLNVFPESFVLWEKLMEEDMIYEEGEEEGSKKHAVLVSELENLIAKPATGMVELLG